MKIKIYVEGGGESNLLRTRCRAGFRRLLENAGFAGRMPAIVACGTRNDAYDSFCTAIKKAKSDDLPVLLVDSEARLKDSAWSHLKALDQWDKPQGCNDDQVYLMVECMEAWFLADHKMLATFFGQGFNEKSLPPATNVETIPKQKIFESLKMATRQCNPKGEYAKGKHSFEILGAIDVKLVRAASPYAENFFAYLELKTNSSS